MGLSFISANRMAMYSPMIPTMRNSTANIKQISTTMVAYPRGAPCTGEEGVEHYRHSQNADKYAGVDAQLQRQIGKAQNGVHGKGEQLP